MENNNINSRKLTHSAHKAEKRRNAEIEERAKKLEADLAELEADGWKVIVVWECELGKKVRDERLERLYREIVDDSGKADDSGE